MRDNTYENLHPIMREPVKRMVKDLADGFKSGATLTQFRLFETYRSPSRQDEVLKEGNSRARGWQSAHQYGLAADFVPVIGVKEAWDWSDHHDWNYLRQIAMKHGLRVPIAWDKPHVEHPEFETMKIAIRQGKHK